MAEQSMSGHAAPRIRSINVRVNLLSQRVEERNRALSVARAKVIQVTSVFVTASVLLPWLINLAASASANAARWQRKASALRAEVSQLNEKAKLVKPRLEERDMIAGAKRHADAFMGQLVSVLNSAPPTMAISGMRVDILGGDVKVSVRADAEDYRSAEAFLDRAKAGAGPQDAGFTSTKRSDVLAKGGISFEFIKKVGLGE
jgi:hypothetical protein